jgi:hypothetical protein
VARNSAGTFTLPPATNPVVSGTQITPNWANGTLSDVATEITDSLSRSGKGGMTAPLRTADGVVGTPAQSFTSETGSGWFRHAAGELRLAILGVYRLAVTAAGAVVNGTLQTIGKLTASAGADVTGTLAVIDDGGTSKKVSIDAPTGLAADYAMTLPAAVPGSTLPVTMTSAGVLATAQLVNSQQNFGTPSAAADVVIKSYLDASTSAVTAVHANLANAPTAAKAPTRAWFNMNASGNIGATGAVVGCNATGAKGSADALFTIPSGYRFSASATQPFLMPVLFFDSSASLLRPAALVCENTNGIVYFWSVDSAGTKIDMANGDFIYLQGLTWVPG